MKSISLLAISLTTFLLSCGQSTKDPAKAFEFYSSVNSQISSAVPQQQRFIDQLTSSLLILKENRAAIIDTMDLQNLFQIAKTANRTRITNLEKLSEFDNNLKYKAATLKYVQAYNELYENEIPRAMAIFGEKSEDRFVRIAGMLLPKFKDLKAYELGLKQMQSDFKAKYEGAAETFPRRTEGNYVFVKLNDFKFPAASLKEGTKIELLSYSGGVDFSDDNIYYKQFIGIDKESGDTLRILALAQLQSYDISRAPRIGTYSVDLPVRGQMTVSEKEYIIFNKDQAEIEQGNYKTVFGILNFEE